MGNLIKLSEELKANLDSIKLVKEEYYTSVVQRLYEHYKATHK